jgi:glucose/arabinose dehydrogenase
VANLRRTVVARLLGVGLGLALSAFAAQAQAPGERIRIDPAALPPPGASPSASNPPDYASAPAGAPLAVPAGFFANRFADGLDHARWLAVAPNGDVFLAESRAGKITVLRDADRDGVAELRATFAAGLAEPHGMAFGDDVFYVADTEAVWRFDYRQGQLEAAGPKQRVTPEGALDTARGHSSRTLAIHPDGSRLFVGIGSSGNLLEDPEPRATVREFGIDGSGGRSFATGLRNPVGLAFQPGTGELWTVVNERDGMGEELVPDYLVRLREGGFYGWPYAYLGPHPQPGFAERRPDLVAKSLPPDLLFRAHSAPLGLVFYDGAAFPPDHRGDAFVALHGSWNAAEPRGYFVARVPFEAGRPTGDYEVFVSGFLVEIAEQSLLADAWDVVASGFSPRALKNLRRGLTLGARRPALVWGRPAGLAVAQDGSLLIADDVAQVVWRVSYRR